MAIYKGSIKVAGGTPDNVVTSDTLTKAKIWTGTKAQYDALASKDANTLYNITDDAATTIAFLPLTGGTMSGEITYSSGKKDSDYLPLSGGTMTGTIKLAGTNGLETSSNTGFKVIDGSGNFKHSRSTNTDFWMLQSNGDVGTHKFYWETGDVIHTGSITAAGGTMTDTLKSVTGASFCRTVDTDRLGLYGGNNGWSSGAYLELYGKSHSSAGSFSLGAHNGTNYTRLEGTANGELCWGGQRLRPIYTCRCGADDSSIADRYFYIGKINCSGGYNMGLYEVNVFLMGNVAHYQKILWRINAGGGATFNPIFGSAGSGAYQLIDNYSGDDHYLWLKTGSPSYVECVVELVSLADRYITYPQTLIREWNYESRTSASIPTLSGRVAWNIL